MNGVSSLRLIASAFPGTGVVMGCVNQPHLYLLGPDPLTAVFNAAHTALEPRRVLGHPQRIPDVVGRLRKPQRDTIPTVGDLAVLRSVMKDLREYDGAKAAVAQAWNASPEATQLRSAAQRERVYAKAAMVSHLFTLLIIVILVGVEVAPLPYLSLALINLGGIYLHYRAHYKADWAQIERRLYQSS